MFQTLVIVGNVGREPEMRFTPNGKQVTSFSVATNRTWKNGDGEQVKETCWFRISAWGKTAEVCSEYLHKGSKVLIEGRLQPGPDGGPRTYERQDGTTAASYEVTAETVRFLNTRGDGTGESADQPAPATTEDEIPF